MMWVILLATIIYVLPAIAFAVLIWISWRYFDKRYKSHKKASDLGLYSASLERTSEVFIDPRDGLKYRVYYNRHTGEREYILEND